MSDLVEILREHDKDPTGRPRHGIHEQAASRISQQDAELERMRREVEVARAALKPFADCARELPDPRVIVEAHPEWKRCERRFHGAVGKLQVRDFRNAYSAFAHQTLKDEVRG